MKKSAKFFLYVFLGAAFVQLLLILYKHYIGYDLVQSLAGFFISWLYASVLSAIMVALVLLLDLWIIRRLEARFPWQRAVWLRLSTEFVVSVSAGALMGLSITLISHLLAPYDEPLTEVLLYNAIIGAVINLILFAILEAILFSRQHQEAQKRSETLERENIQLQFEMLKKQLDPHFLFNSLNVLSSLVRKDKTRAQHFIDEFSSVYRYALDVIDRPVVTVKEELDFAHSYLFLQKIRFEDAVRVEIDVNEKYWHRLVPPLAVQTLLENAFKHNIASGLRPLNIRIFIQENKLLIVNNRQLKKKRAASKGVGFENLKSRYKLISKELPDVVMTEKDYIVKLPLLEPD
jgi:sensor histidine kinase YesM